MRTGGSPFIKHDKRLIGGARAALGRYRELDPSLVRLALVLSTHLPLEAVP